MKQSVTVSAPGKLMLLGEHSVVYNRPCLVTAVDSRVHITITKIEEPVLRINAPEVEIANYERPLDDKTKLKDLPKGVQFIESVLRGMTDGGPLPMGLAIETRNGFSSKYGLGSSSAVSVCMAKGLSELFNLRFSKQEIFNLAYQSVLKVQGVGSGFDVAAAVFGGTLYFKTGGEIIEPVICGNLPFIVVYSGVKADTSTIVKALAKRRVRYEAEIDEQFNAITGLVDNAKAALEQANWDEMGKLMNKNQKILNDLGVSTDILHKLCVTALLAGAKGAKLSGSGGGDCLIILAPEINRHEIEQKLVAAGGILVPVDTGAEGVKIDKPYESNSTRQQQHRSDQVLGQKRPGTVYAQ